MYCTHPSCMLVHTCKSHWKVGGYQTHLLFHSVWTAGAVLAWLPSPSLQSPCTSTAQGPHVHVNMICMQIILHTVCTYTVRMCKPSIPYVCESLVYIWQCTTWRTIPASFLSGSLCQFINSCLHFWRTCLHMWLHESITDSILTFTVHKYSRLQYTVCTNTHAHVLVIHTMLLYIHSVLGRDIT